MHPIAGMNVPQAHREPSTILNGSSSGQDKPGIFDGYFTQPALEQAETSVVDCVVAAENKPDGNTLRDTDVSETQERSYCRKGNCSVEARMGRTILRQYCREMTWRD
jgi:hypothetical protein